MTTYECVICHGINHVVKTTCSTCGTIPAKYSLTRKPVRLLAESMGHLINGFVTVVNAEDCYRQERTKYAKVSLRTVPADYYADLDLD